MADPELLKILEQGSKVWNRWRKKQTWDKPIDLSGTNLSKASLRWADLSRASLSRADLHDTNQRLFRTEGSERGRHGRSRVSKDSENGRRELESLARETTYGLRN